MAFKGKQSLVLKFRITLVEFNPCAKLLLCYKYKTIYPKGKKKTKKPTTTTFRVTVN